MHMLLISRVYTPPVIMQCTTDLSDVLLRNHESHITAGLFETIRCEYSSLEVDGGCWGG